MKIYRNNVELLDVELDDKSVFKSTIMGDEICELNFTSEIFVDFQLQDNIIYNSQYFVINTPPKITKVANNEYTYFLRFEGIKYDLGKVLVKLDGKLDFVLSADISQLVDLIVFNMNEISSTPWKRGITAITPIYDFTISSENCLQLLNRACLDFEVEFEVQASATEYIINVRDIIGVYEGVSLQYKKGIFNITKEAIAQESVITRLYPFGAAKNIPASYGHERIQLPAIELNTDRYGIIEGAIMYEDIFPNFTGTVGSVTSNTFIDNSIDFDINTQLIPGVVAKVVFKTGNLTGYEFDISSYNNSTKQVTLVQLKDDIGRLLPNSSLPIQIGDTYTIVDIYMPQSYIDAAESELNIRAISYLQKYSLPLYKYNITIDARYLRNENISLNVGQKIRLIDLDMGIDILLRIYSITQSLANPYQYVLELTDSKQTNRMIRLIHGQFSIEKTLDEYRKKLRILKNN